MGILAEAQRRAFSVWLRTGRMPIWLQAVPAEFKFNPWHDPENGRFTFAGAGKYFGIGSGSLRTRGVRRTSPGHGEPGFPSEGGSGGGAGASGSYEVNPADQRLFRSLISPAIAKRAVEENWQHVSRNGYHFFIDVSGRTRHVSGVVVLNSDQARSRSAQASAGGSDRRLTDEGGHYIARRFSGPTDAFNHFAQDANFNRGKYRALEEQWARAVRAGKSVTVRIVPLYEGSSQRPSVIDVWFWIDGKPESMKFPNEARKKTDAK